MDKQEKARRLAAIQAILQQASLESGGLESLDDGLGGIELPDTRAAEDARRGALKLAMANLDAVSDEELGGLEAVVMPEFRPVVFVRNGVFEDIHAPWTHLNTPAARAVLTPTLGSIARVNMPSGAVGYEGTAFVVGPNLVMTNRHVAEHFSSGVGEGPMLVRTADVSLGFKHEVDDVDDAGPSFRVTDVVMVHPHWDMALLRVEGMLSNQPILKLSARHPEALMGRDAVVVGYPAWSDRGNVELQDKIFQSTFNVKRVQPGKLKERRTVSSFGHQVNAATHDGSTLGGNSGSAVIDVTTGEVVGLHFAGRYLDANFAVPMWELARDRRVLDAGVQFLGEVGGPPIEWEAAWSALSTARPVGASSAISAISNPTIATPQSAIAAPPPSAPPPRAAPVPVPPRVASAPRAGSLRAVDPPVRAPAPSFTAVAPPPVTFDASAGTSMTVTIPLTITVSIGNPVGAAPIAQPSPHVHEAEPPRPAPIVRAAPARATRVEEPEALESPDDDGLTEVKLVVSEDDVKRVGNAFGLKESKARLRRVSFYDTKELTLKKAGAVLRSRRSDDEDEDDDSTIKLLGATLDEARQYEGTPGFKAEADFVVGRGVVQSLSLTAPRDRGEVQEVERGEREPSHLFTTEQRRLGEEVVPALDWPRAWAEMVCHGPVTTRRWKVKLDGLSKKVVFERWDRADGAKLLEVSIRVATPDTEATGAALVRLLEDVGARPAASEETKTQWVLDAASANEGVLEGLVAQAPLESLEPLEPLTTEHVPALRQLLETNPEAVCSYLSAAVQTPVTRERAEELLDEVAAQLDEENLEGIFSPRVPRPPPADFTFDGYDPVGIPIDVDLTKFEQKRDWFQYIKHSGVSAALYHAGLLPLPEYRWHHEYTSDFAYPLTEAPDEDLRVALFADYANGYYHTHYMARLFEARKYAYAVHLGDIYYAGEAREVRDYLQAPLRPAVQAGMELFLLPGNHEMYSRGKPWRAYLDRKRNEDPSRQRQEGNYFSLWRPGFLVTAIDTAWFAYGRHEKPVLQSWLASRLRDGRKQGRMNILLSSDEPHEYGKPDLHALYTEDIAPLAMEGLIDVWLWGNSHYCALFHPTPEMPFIGSCIGHAGYPYDRSVAGRPSAAPPRFLETGNRFNREDIRPDRGQNGYCEAVLRTDGKLELIYIDWMGNERHRALVERSGGRARFVEQ